LRIRRFGALVCALAMLAAPASAQDRAINQLPNAATPTNGDLLPVWHSGGTYNVSIQQVLAPALFHPLNASQATFGWTGYTFYPGVAGYVPLTVAGSAGQTVDLFDVCLTLGGACPVWVDKSGTLQTLAAPNFGQPPTWNGALGTPYGGTGNTFFTPGRCLETDPFFTGVARFISATGACLVGINVTDPIQSDYGSPSPALWIKTNPTFSGTVFAQASGCGFGSISTTVTTAWLCYGALGGASSGVLRFGNATSGSGYTSIGAANDGAVNGVQNSALSVGVTGTKAIAMDSAGDIGLLGYFAPTSLQPVNPLGAGYGGTGTTSPSCGANGTNTTVSGAFATSCSWSLVPTPSITGMIFGTTPSSSNPLSTTAPYVSQTLTGANLKLVVPTGSMFNFKAAVNSTTENTLAQISSGGCFIPGSSGAVGTAYICGGTGVPAFSAPTGSLFLRYDCASSCLYQNASGASTSGTTWNAVGGGGSQVYPVVARVGFTSTALTQNSYTTVASPSVTLGTSGGLTGAWDVEVSFDATQSAVAVAPGSVCIIGANAGTGGAGTFYSSGTPCQSSPTNALAGAMDVNDPTSSSIATYLPARYSAQYANGTTVSFTCQVRTREASITASGGCKVRATPI
jgi:hypothetical protein